MIYVCWGLGAICVHHIAAKANLMLVAVATPGVEAIMNLSPLYSIYRLLELTYDGEP